MARLPNIVPWYGSKKRLTPKILPFLPYGPGVTVYCEPYCGGASLFFAKDPHPIEVLNDADQRLVSLFRCFQDRTCFDELQHRLRHTLYARAELERARTILEEGGTLADTAWALFVATTMGFSATVASPSWRYVVTATSRGVPLPVSAWLTRLNLLGAWHERLACAQIECDDALATIRRWDTPETVFYLDPPYLPETRKRLDVYGVEADRAHHEALVETLLTLQGYALLSGYQNDLYTRLEDAGWQRHDFPTISDAAARTRLTGIRGTGASKERAARTESLWLSPRLVAFHQARQLTLFDTP